MSRKNVLAPVLISSAHSLAANFTITPTMISFADNVCYQINITNTNSTGTFVVQGSLDYIPATPNGLPAATGNWVDLSLGGGSPTVAASNDVIMINLMQLPFNAIRLSYTSTIAGTGVASVYVMHKQVGG